jgi:[acyl-carrier-protein] S-malonyltransferase
MGIHILHRNSQYLAAPSTARVFLFPGQSSGGPDILLRALRAHPAAAHVADRASAVLGTTRAAEYLSADGASLRSNRDTQVTVFLATQMYLAALHAEGIDAATSIGLSLGEYSHLVHIGALDLDDALQLVDERGRCYDEAPPGIMATVLAVDHETVASVVARAQVHGLVVISNINAPTQHVIAGAEAAVTWAAATLEDDHAAHITIIDRRVPMHSPMMAPVADAFVPALTRAPWRVPASHYVPNVTGAPIARATAADFVQHLMRHVSEPVLWQASVDHLVATHPEATLIEVGPGGVLHNMIGRAWRGARRARVDAPNDIEPHQHFSATVEALRA